MWISLGTHWGCLVQVLAEIVLGQDLNMTRYTWYQARCELQVPDGG